MVYDNLTSLSPNEKHDRDHDINASTSVGILSNDIQLPLSKWRCIALVVTVSGANFLSVSLPWAPRSIVVLDI